MPDAPDTVRVSVKSVAVEHTVKIGEFTAWVKRNGAKSPAEMTRRQKIREILELPV
jgi:hypothetical protein